MSAYTEHTDCCSSTVQQYIQWNNNQYILCDTIINSHNTGYIVRLFVPFVYLPGHPNANAITRFVCVYVQVSNNNRYMCAGDFFPCVHITCRRATQSRRARAYSHTQWVHKWTCSTCIRYVWIAYRFGIQRVRCRCTLYLCRRLTKDIIRLRVFHFYFCYAFDEANKKKLAKLNNWRATAFGRRFNERAKGWEAEQVRESQQCKQNKNRKTAECEWRTPATKNAMNALRQIPSYYIYYGVWK